MILVLSALLALLMMSPEIGRNSCLRHAIENYFELNYYKYLLQLQDSHRLGKTFGGIAYYSLLLISLAILWLPVDLLNIFGKKIVL